jgi:predicted phosphodiesterase
MKFCIISDLHCTDKKGENSLFYSDIPDKPINQNPVSSILAKIEAEEFLHSDIVLCLGDLGDKAYRQGIKTAWEAVDRIKSKMKAKVLIGIPGNHDVDSRNRYHQDPFKYVVNFNTNFPTSESKLNDSFWNKGFCIYKSDGLEILMINSVINHKNEESAKVSEISLETLENIEADLEIELEINRICILHHHPIKHSNIENWKDSDSLDKGDKLIDLLNKYNYDIIIHGHKHQPRIVEYSGLTVFATGSFSSFDNLQASGYKTMFHVLEILEKGRGKVFSWEFNLQNGWKSELNPLFPATIGFGEQIDLKNLADRINTYFLNCNESVLLYSQIETEFPEISYLIPDKLVKLKEFLNRNYELFLEPDFPLIPSLITRK